MAVKQLPGVFDADFTDVSETHNDVDDQIDMALAELGSDPDEVHVKIGVYKSLPGKGKVAWLFDTLPDEMPDIKLRIRNQYGSGDYEFRIYKNGRIFKRCRFCVEVPTRPEPTTQPQNSELSSILHMMLEQQNKQAEEFKALIVGLNNKPQVSMVDNLGPMIGLMLQAKQLFSQPPQNNGNQIDMLLKGVELAKEIGGGGGESSMLDVVRDLLKSPILGEAIKLGASSQQGPQRPRQEPQHPRQSPPATMLTAPSQPTPAHTPKQEDPPVLNISQYLIRAQIDMLINAAKRGDPPDLVAQQVLDNAPDSVLENYIFVDNAIERLAEIHQGILPHRNWFENVQGHIFALYERSQIGDENDLTTTLEHDLIDNNGTDTARIDGNADRSGGNTRNVALDVAASPNGKNV